MSEHLNLRFLRSARHGVGDVHGGPSGDAGVASSRAAPSFKSLQWTPDGTTVLAGSTDNTVRTYILPPDLLDSADRSLSAYHTHQAPSPVYAVAAHTGFELSQPSSCVYLCSPASLPVRLVSPFTPDLVATYPLTNPNTEAYIAPHSLCFGAAQPGQFVAGSDSQLSVFDLSRPGAAPLLALPTIPSKRKRVVGGGVGMKGIVSALAAAPHGVLAAGTFSRWVGLYDADGAGDAVAVFHLPDDGMAGFGVTQVQWSDCGRYLYVAERGAEGIGVWDVRGSGARLAWLKGRRAGTMQRLAFDASGRDVWAGGTDGSVRVWRAVDADDADNDPAALLEEDGTPSRSPWAAAEVHPGCAVAGAALHPSGSVLATCGSVPQTDTNQEAEDGSSDEDTGRERDEEPPLSSELTIWACEQQTPQPELVDRTLVSA